MQAGAELLRTQINVVKSKCILKALSAAAIRQLTMHHSLVVDVDFKKRGKPNNAKKNSRSRGETNYNNFKYKNVGVLPIRII